MFLYMTMEGLAKRGRSDQSLDEGLLPYEKEEIDLYEAAKETIEHLDAAAKQRGISDIQREDFIS